MFIQIDFHRKNPCEFVQSVAEEIYTFSEINSFNVIPNRVTPSRIRFGAEYEKLIRIVFSPPPLG
jgi:hypothetical protein